MNQTFDFCIIGGGIVGLAAGLKITQRVPGAKVCVLEKEKTVAAHQTGHNSGVIHSGLYYKPGSAKAKTCVDGRVALIEFCKEHGVKFDLCGKLVVATSEAELPSLAELQRRGVANGIPSLEEWGPEQIKEKEPYSAGIKALWVPGTGIVDYPGVTQMYAKLIEKAGGEVRLNTRATSARSDGKEEIVLTTNGEVRAKYLVNCGGLLSDRVAKLCGAKPDAKIVPFRGEYYMLTKEAEHMVKGLIYPVPDPRFPFLGVHFTRMIHGGAEAGPNAVLALKREGYTRTSFSLRDTFDTFTYPGFWRMAAKHWRMGFGEMYRSWSKKAFVKALQKLMPAIEAKHLQPGGAGVRAQAMSPDGGLVDDFRIVRQERAIHVLNAPSPAATASLSIGDQIAGMALEMGK